MGALEQKGPEYLKGPKIIYRIIGIAEKQSKRSKKGPFSLYIGPPGSHSGNGIDGARRGRSLPVHTGFSSHAAGSASDDTFHIISLIKKTSSAIIDLAFSLVNLADSKLVSYVLFFCRQLFSACIDETQGYFTKPTVSCWDK